MNLKRVGPFGVGVALAAWLATAATSDTRQAVQPVAVTTPRIDMRGAALDSEIARLHEQLRPSTAPRQPGRNLFTFAPKPIARPAPSATTQAPPTETVAARPLPPALKLSGIAEDVAPGGVVRTAIISGFGQLFFAKEGDTVTDRYRVVRISSEVVELSDLVDATAIRLALK